VPEILFTHSPQLRSTHPPRAVHAPPGCGPHVPRMGYVVSAVVLLVHSDAEGAQDINLWVSHTQSLYMEGMSSVCGFYFTCIGCSPVIAD